MFTKLWYNDVRKAVKQTKYKKERGQSRKLKALTENTHLFVPFEDTDIRYEHFHVPSGPFISSPKTSGKVKTAFCKVWLQKAEEIIKQKPSDLPFCKVVAIIDESDLWESQIVIFYDEKYYGAFWTRNTPEQTWAIIEDPTKSFIKERNIKTQLNEMGYLETISGIDFNKKSVLWLYGEI